MDKGAFGLDLLCDRLTGGMLAVEEIFLVFKLVCCDLAHSFLFSRTAEQIRAWTAAFSSDWEELRWKLNSNFVRINPPSPLLSLSRICFVDSFSANQHTCHRIHYVRCMSLEWKHVRVSYAQGLLKIMFTVRYGPVSGSRKWDTPLVGSRDSGYHRVHTLRRTSKSIFPEAQTSRALKS